MQSDFIGGAIAVVAAVASIFGINLQKYSHDKEETRVKQRPYHLRPLWWVGMICVVGASIGDFAALAFAPQTLVASLGGGSTILGNCLMSRFWLKQSLYITDITGVGLVTMGVVILAAASEESNGHYKMDQIYQLMQAAPFILYCLITTAFVMTLYLRVRRSKAPALRVKDDSLTPSADSDKSTSSSSEQESSLEDEDQASRSAMMSPFPSPIFGDRLHLSPMRRLPGEEDDPSDSDSVTRGSSKHMLSAGEIEKHTLVIDPKLPLYWAAISGVIGGQSVLLAKCVAEMISSTVEGDNQFRYFGTYVIVAGMVGTLLTQTHTLNMATMSGDTMSSYPIFQAFWISMSNISGVVFFQQAHNFTSTQWTMFPLAIAFVLLGVLLISKHEKFGNRIKYSVAMPVILSSPRQHDIVAQSFVFRVSTPQKLQDSDYSTDSSNSEWSPRRRASVDVV